MLVRVENRSQEIMHARVENRGRSQKIILATVESRSQNRGAVKK